MKSKESAYLNARLSHQGRILHELVVGVTREEGGVQHVHQKSAIYSKKLCLLIQLFQTIPAPFTVNKSSNRRKQKQ